MKLKDLFESTGKSVADLKIDYKGGDFDCSHILLTSLEGAPSHVDGNFYCNNNQLTSLEGAPSHVDGNFYCNYDQLMSLEGAPSHVGGNFCCYDNQLTSLEGSPSHVDGNFDCSYNRLTSLEGIHQQIKTIAGAFYAPENPIKSHVLGLMLINEITKIELDNKQVEEILNRHLGKGRAGMLMAQEELIEAGLEEFAQL